MNRRVFDLLMASIMLSGVTLAFASIWVAPIPLWSQLVITAMGLLFGGGFVISVEGDYRAEELYLLRKENEELKRGR